MTTKRHSKIPWQPIAIPDESMVVSEVIDIREFGGKIFEFKNNMNGPITVRIYVSNDEGEGSTYFLKKTINLTPSGTVGDKTFETLTEPWMRTYFTAVRDIMPVTPEGTLDARVVASQF